MSVPERPTPDPFSLALGRIEGRLDGIEKRLDALERYTLWGFGITWTLIVASGLLGGVLRHG